MPCAWCAPLRVLRHRRRRLEREYGREGGGGEADEVAEARREQVPRRRQRSMGWRERRKKEEASSRACDTGCLVTVFSFLCSRRFQARQGRADRPLDSDRGSRCTHSLAAEPHYRRRVWRGCISVSMASPSSPMVQWGQADRDTERQRQGRGGGRKRDGQKRQSEKERDEACRLVWPVYRQSYCQLRLFTTSSPESAEHRRQSPSCRCRFSALSYSLLGSADWTGHW